MSTVTRATEPAGSRGYLRVERTRTTVNDEPRDASFQLLTLVLDGITAADYMCWVRNPEPAVLGRALRQLNVRAEPLGDRIELELLWEGEPPAPHAAATAAGFPLTEDVIELVRQPLAPSTRTHSPRSIRAVVRIPRAIAAIAAAGAIAAAAPSGAAAASLVYVRAANVWIANPDGTRARPLTTDGTHTAPYMSPSEDDHGVIVAQRGSLFVRLDHSGRTLGTIPSLATGAPAGSTGSGPFAPRVSPNGEVVAYFMGSTSGSYDTACQCTLQSDEEDVVYAHNDGLGTLGTSRFWRSPSWATRRT